MRYFYKKTDTGYSFAEAEVTQKGYNEVSKAQYEALLVEAESSEAAVFSRVSKAKSDFRKYRGAAFRAFDIYKTNIEYGVVTETALQHEAIVEWYDDMLNFPELITPESIEGLKFPAIPEAIAQYVQGGVSYEPFTD